MNILHEQVQTVGLHVLKGIAQSEIAEGPHMKNRSFSLFIIGELFEDVFLLIQHTVKVIQFKFFQNYAFNISTKHFSWQESISRESVSIIEECLRLLLLFYTLSKDTECLQETIMLLLDALLMVFSVSCENYSQVI